MADKPKLDVNALLSVIKSSQTDALDKNVTKLSQSKRLLEKQKTRAPTRVSKKQAQEINYEIVNQQMSEYLPTVKKNREAVTLDFKETQTNKHYEVAAPKDGEFVKAVAEGKMDTYEALNKAENKIVNGKDLSELIKAKHLLLYKELKQKRIKKIKSKLYHKIKKRQTEGKKGEELADAMQKNKNVLFEELEKLEYKRAQERATLKHRNDNKYAKLLKRYGDSKEIM